MPGKQIKDIKCCYAGGLQETCCAFWASCSLVAWATQTLVQGELAAAGPCQRVESEEEMSGRQGELAGAVEGDISHMKVWCPACF